MIAVVVAAIVGLLALILGERDYAAPHKPPPSAPAQATPKGEVPSKPEAKSVPEGLQPKPDDKGADKKKPPPPPVETVIIQRPGRGAIVDEQSADTFMQFDADRDGVVDRYEARYSDFLTSNFDAIDTSRDGKVSMDEMRAFDAKRAK